MVLVGCCAIGCHVIHGLSEDAELKRISDEFQESDGIGRNSNDMFMESFRLQDDVTTLPSGVMFRILSSSPNPNAKATQLRSDIKVKAVALDIDEYKQGKVIDPIESIMSPATVSDGLREALLLMHDGDYWEIVIPFHLTGLPESTVIIYKISLLEVDPDVEDLKEYILRQLGKPAPYIEFFSGWQLLMLISYVLIRIILRLGCGVGRGISKTKRS